MIKPKGVIKKDLRKLMRDCVCVVEDQKKPLKEVVSDLDHNDPRSLSFIKRVRSHCDQRNDVMRPWRSRGLQGIYHLAAISSVLKGGRVIHNQQCFLYDCHRVRGVCNNCRRFDGSEVKESAEYIYDFCQRRGMGRSEVVIPKATSRASG